MPNYLEHQSPSNFRSKFNPIVGINKDYIETFNSNFLDPLFKQMTSVLGIHPNAFEYLNIEELITEKEFENSKNLELAKPYFYELIFDKITSSSDYIDCSRQTLRALQFQLKDTVGNVIDLHGANISCSLVFDMIKRK